LGGSSSLQASMVAWFLPWSDSGRIDPEQASEITGNPKLHRHHPLYSIIARRQHVLKAFFFYPYSYVLLCDAFRMMRGVSRQRFGPRAPSLRHMHYSPKNFSALLCTVSVLSQLQINERGHLPYFGTIGQSGSGMPQPQFPYGLAHPLVDSLIKLIKDFPSCQQFHNDQITSHSPDYYGRAGPWLFWALKASGP
jgi:hypothetical protein